MKNFNKLTAFALLLTLGITSGCEKDKKDDPVTPTGAYAIGTYITNEGSFGAANGSLSFYNSTTNKVENNIFAKENSRPLGDVVQSIGFDGNNGYILVNNSGKIEVIDRNTARSTATINDVPGIRFFTSAGNGTGFVSQWGATEGHVLAIDLAKNSVSQTINVGSGPEQMVIANGHLYVGNSGGFGKDSTISVIDINTLQVVKTIETKHNPASLVTDGNGKVWVLCRGAIEYDPVTYAIVSETPSYLVNINTNTMETGAEVKIADTQHPNWLAISPDGNTLYYGGGYGFAGIFAMPVNASTAPTEPFIDESAYGLGVNPVNGNLFVTLAPSFTENGTVKRFDSQGKELGSYEAGIGPNGTGTKQHKM